MKLIEKIIIEFEGKLIHIFFKDKIDNISYTYSNRFKLVVNTIDRRTENERKKQNSR